MLSSDFSCSVSTRLEGTETLEPLYLSSGDPGCSVSTRLEGTERGIRHQSDALPAEVAASRPDWRVLKVRYCNRAAAFLTVAASRPDWRVLKGYSSKRVMRLRRVAASRPDWRVLKVAGTPNAARTSGGVAASRPDWRVLKDDGYYGGDFQQKRCSVSTRLEGTERG